MTHGTTVLQIQQAARLSCRMFGSCVGITVQHQEGCLAITGVRCACRPEVTVSGSGEIIHVDRRGRVLQFPPNATNDVTCTGEALHPIVWMNQQWAVTDYGLECRDGLYAIGKGRLGEAWLRHMRDKEWVDQGAFREAIRLARHWHAR